MAIRRYHLMYRCIHCNSLFSVPLCPSFARTPVPTELNHGKNTAYALKCHQRMAFVYRTKAMANLGVCFIVTLCSCVCARVCVYRP